MGVRALDLVFYDDELLFGQPKAAGTGSDAQRLTIGNLLGMNRENIWHCE